MHSAAANDCMPKRSFAFSVHQSASCCSATAHALESTEDHPSQSRYPWKGGSQGPTPSTGSWLNHKGCPAARNFAAKAESHGKRKVEGEHTDHTWVRTTTGDVPVPGRSQGDAKWPNLWQSSPRRGVNAEFNIPIRPLTITLISSTCTSLTINCLLLWERSWGALWLQIYIIKVFSFFPKHKMT